MGTAHMPGNILGTFLGELNIPGWAGENFAQSQARSLGVFCPQGQ